MKEELEQVLLTNAIDVTSDLKDCKDFMQMYGWTIKKQKKIKNEDRLVMYNRVIKKAKDFTGVEIQIMKGDEIIGALMENERNALLVCILEVIRNRSK
jgi:hypothetical protein